ncbi:hypothetical protein BB559_001175 [Furculomyces boomerangus]|uniref:Uncharacterized protein n=1 Tax=Furculomyces boomerangus TaxID=61424 RepID=A0A2T9Z2S7_9FUNG|nr:hypothetical protein BB559_001175 [Furculomyces boomerangus]
MDPENKEKFEESEEEFIRGEEIENEVPSDEDEMMDDEEDEQNEGQERKVVFEDDSIQGFFSHKEPVYSVAINPKDENMIVSGGGDDSAYIWRRDNGEAVYKLKKHEDSVTSVGFSNDGKFLATGGMDGIINVYKSGIEEIYCQLDGPDEVMWMNWHPTGNVFIAGSNDTTIWMYNASSKACMNVFHGHSGPVSCGQFTNNGKNIVSGSEDGSLILWNPASASVIQKFTPEDKRFHQDAITSISVNKDDTIFVTGSVDGTGKLVHKNGSILGSLEGHTDSVETVGISDSLALAATGSVDGSLCVWDINTLRLRNTFKHDDAVTKLKWHNNSPLITSSSADCTIKVWDSRSGECVRVWKGHQDTILDFALSNDGNTVVTASDDGCCLVFA